MPRRPTRQNEILALLARYGVMSTGTISKLLPNKSGSSWLREALRVLVAKRLVVSANSTAEGRAMSYWMLPDEESALARTEVRTGIDRVRFRNKRTRYTSYPHEN